MMVVAMAEPKTQKYNGLLELSISIEVMLDQGHHHLSSLTCMLEIQDQAKAAKRPL